MPLKRTVRKRVGKALTKYVRGKNPSKRASEKRASRALTKYVRNFTGTITRTGDGEVIIAGTGPKPKTAKNPKGRYIPRTSRMYAVLESSTGDIVSSHRSRKEAQSAAKSYGKGYRAVTVAK